MTQPHLIEQAKQGDPQAIAALMNKSLQEKGMVAYVDRQGDALSVVLEADRIPNRQALTAFVEKGIQNLEIESIKAIHVSGKQFGSDTPAWTHQLYLETPTPEFEPEAFLEDESDFLATSSFDDFSTETARSDDFSTDFSTTLDEPLLDNEFGWSSEPSSSEDFGLEDPNLDLDANSLFGEEQFGEGQFGEGQFGEDQFNSSQPISDFSQLQDLLAEQPDQPSNQRQELEERLDSLWAEQSEEQSQDFLSELLSDTPDQPSVQFEDSSASESTGMWLEDTEGPDDEPDEVLLSFLDEPVTTPPIPEPGEGEFGNDEPDEILMGFLDQSSESPELSGLPPLEEQPNQEWIELPQASSGFEDLTSDQFAAPSQQDEFLSFLEEEPTTEPNLDLSLDTEEEQFQEFSQEFSLDTPDSPLDTEEAQFAEFSEQLPQDPTPPEPLNEAPLSESLSPATEASLFEDDLNFGTEPSTLEDTNFEELDLLANDPDEFADANMSWEEPPIELLQDDLELPQPDFPTEQIDNFSAIPSEQYGEFPQDFLQDTPEPSLPESDLLLEPESNPFLEQLGGQPASSQDVNEFGLGTEEPVAYNQFNPSEWQPADEDLSDQPDELDLSSLDLSMDDPSLSASSEFEPDPLYGTGLSFDLENDDQDASLTDAALTNEDEEIIDFFQEPEPLEPATSETVIQPPVTQIPDSEWQFNDSNPATTDLSAANLDTQLPDESYGTDVWQLNAEEDYPPTSEPDEPLTADSHDPIDHLETLPPHTEPSQEALEEQLASFDVGNTTETAPESTAGSRNSFWFFLTLLGISGWVVGLITFAFLWSRLSSPPPTPETSTAISTPAPAPGTATPATVPSLTCTATPATANARPIELTNVQFEPNSANPQQVNVVGCVTNRTQKPIDLVSIAYRPDAATTPVVGGLNFTSGTIQPGQSVPFTSKFTLPSDITNVAVDTVYWQTAGAKISQEARASLSLNR